jgi:hypothetical protein
LELVSGHSRLSGQLEQLDRRAGHLRVPNAFANLLYQLRTHIGLVRSRLAIEAG